MIKPIIIMVADFFSNEVGALIEESKKRRDINFLCLKK